MKKESKIVGVGLITAIASSLCCIVPVLALISGTTGIASTFDWLEPFRPFLIIFTVLMLGFAWNQKLKKEVNCYCANNEKKSFFQSKLFLSFITVFAISMTFFPYYSSAFYSTPKKNIIVVNNANIKTINLKITGMTCSSCEEHINHTVNQLNGVLNAKSSYENGNAVIEFDKTKTTKNEIEKAINLTGYKVIKQ